MNIQSKMYRPVFTFPDTVEEKLDSKSRKQIDIKRYREMMSEAEDYTEARSFGFFVQNAEKELFGEIKTDVDKKKYLGRFRQHQRQKKLHPGKELMKPTPEPREGRITMTDEFKSKIRTLIDLFGSNKVLSDIIDPLYPNMIYSSLKCRTIKSDYYEAILSIYEQVVENEITVWDFIQDYDVAETNMIRVTNTIRRKVTTVLGEIVDQDLFRKQIGCTRQAMINVRNNDNDKIRVEDYRKIEKYYEEIGNE